MNTLKYLANVLHISSDIQDNDSKEIKYLEETNDLCSMYIELAKTRPLTNDELLLAVGFCSSKEEL